MPSVRVKAPAGGQDRQHDAAGQRIDQAQKLSLLESVDEKRIQAEEHILLPVVVKRLAGQPLPLSV